ncbi:unnamed protein product [Effrenium voratum]|uniref:Uncharacterized protein n=1 Tax=Effrenium voratum TaxID=2562239 RepID=A0AA36I5F4_9DINO|nr:unnamed protein product [Effrenium voratum]CAJ1431919.1 unnamed protein product [Effrenium voratum]
MAISITSPWASTSATSAASWHRPWRASTRSDAGRSVAWRPTSTSAKLVAALVVSGAHRKCCTRRTAALPREAVAAVFPPSRSSPIDQYGRHWQAAVSRIGPAIPKSCANAAASWRSGAGQLRVACYEAGPVSALALRGETLCLASAGRIRAVDVRSGDKVGEYYIGSHVPATITALHFNDDIVVGSDSGGGLHAWRSEFPDCCGTASANITFAQDGASAHDQAITGLLVAERLIVSSSLDGSVSFWNIDDAKGSRLQPRSTSKFESPPSCLCSAGSDAVYVGFQDGSVKKLQGDLVSDVSPSSDVAVTALAFHEASGSLIAGLCDGQVLLLQEDGEAAVADAFHSQPVTQLQFLSHSEEAMFLSTGSDGRVGVWNCEGEPLWGLRGLAAGSIAIAADSSRLFFNGVVMNPATPGNLVFVNNWREIKAPFDEAAPACECILCVEFAK